MKKRFTMLLASLLLVMGTAWAQVNVKYAFTFNRTAGTVAVKDAAGNTVEGVTATIAVSSPNPYSYLTDSNAANDSILCINKNTNAATSESPNSYTLTIKGLPEDFCMNSVAFRGVALNSGGAFQGSDVDRKRYFKVSYDENELEPAACPISINGKSGSNPTNNVFDLTESYSAAGNDLVVDVDIYNATSANNDINTTQMLGCFYGLTAITLDGTISTITNLDQLSNDMVFGLQCERAPLVSGESSLTHTFTNSSGLIAGDVANANEQFAILRTGNTEEGLYYLYSISAEKFVKADKTYSDTPVASLTIADNSSYSANYRWKLYLGDVMVNINASGIVLNSNASADQGNQFKIEAGAAKDLSAVVAAIAEVEEVEEDIYAPVNTGTRTRNDRKLSNVSLSSKLSTSNAANSTALTHTGNGLQYIDLTESVTMKVYAGENVTATVTGEGSWWHAYTYIDLQGDGFTAGINEEDSYTPTEDLMTYSCYSINTSTWYNSVGSVSDNSIHTMPAFTAPATPGTYRMRFKTDWNNIMPDGGEDTSSKQNQFVSAGGTIVDVMLEVVEAPSNVTIIYDFVYEGATKLSQENLLQLIGDEYPDINVTLPFGVVPADKPTGNIDINDAINGVITKEIALSIEGLPFEFSADFANAKWYYMPLHNTGKYYLSYTAEQTYIPLDSDQQTLPEEGHDAYLWAFVGNPFDGYKIMNKAAGNGMILSSSTNTEDNNTGGSTHPLMKQESELTTDTDNIYWIPTASTHATNGFYLEQKDNSANKMNVRDNKLAYWNGGQDGGSTFRVTTLADFANYNISDLLGDAGNVGYPKTSSGAYTTLNAVNELDGRATVLDVELAISAYKTTTDIALPEDGKAYTIANYSRNDKTRYLNYTAGAALSVSEDVSNASVFVCKKLSDGVYTLVTSDGKVLTWMHSAEGYKENEAYNGYSTEYGTAYNGYSDWNKITVKKNGTNEVDYGYLRMVARRHHATDKQDAPNSSFIIKGSTGDWDRAGDNYFFDNSGNYYSSAWIFNEVEHESTEAQALALAKIGALGNKIMGEGIGYYHYTFEGEIHYNNEALYTATTVDEVNAIAATITINLPAAGFYRIKSQNGNYADRKGKYIQNSISEDGLAIANTADANSIMYYNGNNILSYASGLYINKYDTNEAIGAVGTEPTTWVVMENADIAGTYALKHSDGWYMSDWNSATNTTYGNNDANAAWIFEEVTTLPVAVSAVGYATLYAPVALNIPEGVTAYTGTVKGEWLDLTEIEGVIPAGTGVILESVFAEDEEKVAKEFSFSTASATDNIASALVGHEAAHLASSVEGTPYTLQTHEDGGVVFRKYIGINLGGFKSYIVLPEATAAQAIRIRKGNEVNGDGGTTGIDGSVLEAQDSQHIYDLMGRKVTTMKQGGIYIVNGKKVVK